jgi:type I restriction enzyme S subunit
MRVPEGWRETKIADIADIQVGRDLNESAYSEVKTDQHRFPVFSNTVENRGLYGFYDFEEYSGNSVTIVGRGIGLGTAFSRKKGCGYGAIGRLLVVNPINDSFDVDFFANYVNFRLRIFNESGGIPQLPGSQLAKYHVVLPPFPEQQQIAQILSTWDKAIEKLEALIAAKQKRKKALMQQLLTGKKRFANFDEKWTIRKLSEISESFSGGTPSRNTPEYFNGEIPWIKSGEVNQRVIFRSEEKITQLGLKNSSAKVVPKNNVLVAMYGATAGKVAITKIDAAINQAILAIIPNANISTDFLFYLIELEMDDSISLVQGGQPNLNAGILKSLKLKIPELVEQDKIASLLSAADSEIETHQKQLAALKAQKKGLMQQLLTGKKRVKVDSHV